MTEVKVRLKKNGGLDGVYRGCGVVLHEGDTMTVSAHVAKLICLAHPDWFDIVKEKAVSKPSKNKLVKRPGRNK
jgi:hypothetical protein